MSSHTEFQLQILSLRYTPRYSKYKDLYYTLLYTTKSVNPENIKMLLVISDEVMFFLLCSKAEICTPPPPPPLTLIIISFCTCYRTTLKLKLTMHFP